MNPLPEKKNTRARLSADERAAMKREFMSFMDANPPVLRRPAGVLSPYFPHLTRISALVATALLVVSGTTYAAEQSLPNDLLYPMKTRVIEPVFIEGLAFTDTAKAKASHSLVTRRLEEAEALMETDELDTDTAVTIAAAIEEHAEDVQAYVAEASANGEISDALTISADLESTLEAHGDVLASIIDGEPSIEAIHTLIDEVREHADSVENAGEAIEEQAAQNAPESEEYLTETVKEAGAKITEVRERIAGTSANEEHLSQATALLTAAESSYAAGNAELANGNKSGALPLIREALQGADQAGILLESGEELTGE